jgi:DNA-binding NarL/FixJ family response regulator
VPCRSIPAPGRWSGHESELDELEAALTRRELEIAGLVTDRRTNREIAGASFLSEKTIATHTRNIFVKLGASSRMQVARAVERAQREHDGSPQP